MQRRQHKVPIKNRRGLLKIAVNKAITIPRAFYLSIPGNLIEFHGYVSYNVSRPSPEKLICHR